MLRQVDATEAQAWVASYSHDATLHYRMRWALRGGDGPQASGTAIVSVGPRDTLHFKLNGPFGWRGSVLIAADRVEHATPEAQLRALPPAAALYWAAVGLPRSPPAGAIVSRGKRDGEQTWRYVFADSALTYVASSRPPAMLRAHLSAHGRLVGTSVVAFDTLTQLPTTGHILIARSVTSVLAFRVEGVDSVMHSTGAAGIVRPATR